MLLISVQINIWCNGNSTFNQWNETRPKYSFSPLWVIYWNRIYIVLKKSDFRFGLQAASQHLSVCGHVTFYSGAKRSSDCISFHLSSCTCLLLFWLSISRLCNGQGCFSVSRVISIPWKLIKTFPLSKNKQGLFPRKWIIISKYKYN